MATTVIGAVTETGAERHELPETDPDSTYQANDQGDWKHVYALVTSLSDLSPLRVSR